MRHAIAWSLMVVATILLASPLAGQDTKPEKPDAPAKTDQDTAAGDQESDESAEPDEEKELTPTERFARMGKEFVRTTRRLAREIRKAKEKEERAELAKQLNDARVAFGRETMELVGQVDDANEQAEMLVWVAINVTGDLKKQATERLLKDYLDSPAVGSFAMRLARERPGSELEQKLRNIIEQSNNDTVKGQATYALVGYFIGLQRYAELDEEVRDRFAKAMGEETMEYINQWTPEKIDIELESLLNSCIDNYADVEIGQRKLGDIADNRLFALKNLRIGKVAPDIEGVDLDGEEFKLSDYRGKVVVLDFWGDW